MRGSGTRAEFAEERLKRQNIDHLPCVPPDSADACEHKSTLLCVEDVLHRYFAIHGATRCSLEVYIVFLVHRLGQ